MLTPCHCVCGEQWHSLAGFWTQRLTSLHHVCQLPSILGGWRPMAAIESSFLSNDCFEVNLVLSVSNFISYFSKIRMLNNGKLLHKPTPFAVCSRDWKMFPKACQGVPLIPSSLRPVHIRISHVSGIIYTGPHFNRLWFPMGWSTHSNLQISNFHPTFFCISDSPPDQTFHADLSHCCPLFVLALHYSSYWCIHLWLGTLWLGTYVVFIS